LKLVILETVDGDIELGLIAFLGGEGRGQGVDHRTQLTDLLLCVLGLGMVVSHCGRKWEGLGG
jgi:hypothetical protein